MNPEELNKEQLNFSILENMVILFEKHLPSKILKSEEFKTIKIRLENLYQKIK